MAPCSFLSPPKCSCASCFCSNPALQPPPAPVGTRFPVSLIFPSPCSYSRKMVPAPAVFDSCNWPHIFFGKRQRTCDLFFALGNIYLKNREFDAKSVRSFIKYGTGSKFTAFSVRKQLSRVPLKYTTERISGFSQATGPLWDKFLKNLSFFFYYLL